MTIASVNGNANSPRWYASGTIAIEPRTARIVAGRKPRFCRPWNSSSDARPTIAVASTVVASRPSFRQMSASTAMPTPVMTRVVRSGAVPAAAPWLVVGARRAAWAAVLGGGPPTRTRASRPGADLAPGRDLAVERGVVVLGGARPARRRWSRRRRATSIGSNVLLGPVAHAGEEAGTARGARGGGVRVEVLLAGQVDRLGLGEEQRHLAGRRLAPVRQRGRRARRGVDVELDVDSRSLDRRRSRRRRRSSSSRASSSTRPRRSASSSSPVVVGVVVERRRSIAGLVGARPARRRADPGQRGLLGSGRARARAAGSLARLGSDRRRSTPVGSSSSSGASAARPRARRARARRRTAGSGRTVGWRDRGGAGRRRSGCPGPRAGARRCPRPSPPGPLRRPGSGRLRASCAQARPGASLCSSSCSSSRRSVTASSGWPAVKARPRAAPAPCGRPSRRSRR